ncbi:MAG: hypothetical protein LKJ41_01235 [[Lactobacillus] timonensis]|uniref:hypothetical protein n=1 Tax=[Lactobacillus] timonensis TaxID=1970790 RepID=UPI002355676E|nr:hypothetical protein [[Lactobacillus] timonensis]MCI1956989.1 hypothetical protein [[Lactobacillus] timonensis]MCI1970055.1 hypothetical protein [[Lactobacillus] timonensis]
MDGIEPSASSSDLTSSPAKKAQLSECDSPKLQAAQHQQNAKRPPRDSLRRREI